ncbi:secreted protein C-like [Stomoxys calcitrans]|uniref:secreted protein C-like n=1 Tax=Stomoxys calcitrans TaxID=35570 RepID=UPI0027E26EC2|nr:secreted protein C-like [Stomoxys calcitrans]
MRAFIVLCLVAVASADKLGYNYQPVGHSSSGLSFTPGGSGGGSSFGGGSHSAPSASYGGQQGSFGGGSPSSHGGSFAPSSQGEHQGSFGPSSGSGPSSFGGQQGSVGGGSGHGPSSFDGQGSSSSPSVAPQGELEKQFFTYTADDEEFHDPQATNQFANSVKQALRVVFIKGPESSGLEDAALALAKNSASQKTDVYVLNKQPDLATLAEKLNQISSSSNTQNRPDVHFVKYRTPEDAANAQKAIQGQYDALGGQSQNVNGGVAPVLNFASQAPIARQSASAPGASYLPASIFRH